MTRTEARSQHRTALVVGLALALVAGACNGGGTTSTVAPDDLLWSGPPEVRDVSAYAEGLGISGEEARRRNDLVESFLTSEVADWLDRRREFYWVEEDADTWGVVIGRRQVFRNFVRKLEERLAGTEFEGLVEVRSVRNDRDDLEGFETTMAAELERWCLPPMTSFEIDYAANRAEIGVQSLGEFATAAGLVGMSFNPERMVIVERPIADPLRADTEPCEAPLRAFQVARANWLSHGVDRYSYRATRSVCCVVSPGSYEVTVWDGEVTEIIPPELEPGDLLYPAQFETRFGTIEDLFDIVSTHPVQWMTADYDDDWGFPTEVRFRDPYAADAAWSFRIDNFRLQEERPEPVPVRAPRTPDGSLEIEHYLPWDAVIVDGLIGPTLGLVQGWGWRQSLEVARVVYRAPGAPPLDPSGIEVIDRAQLIAPRALLHLEGEDARLMLREGPDGWHVFAVMRSTSDGLRFDGPLARRGYSEEIGYLCHYPRSDIPTDPPPVRDAEVEFDLLVRWMDERGVFDRQADNDEVSRQALRRACGVDD